jgi:deoxyribodipyrimidine photolyase
MSISRRLNNNPDASPAERIRTAKREIEWHYWFLKRHLADLSRQLKEVGKVPAARRRSWPASSLEKAIEEMKGLAIQRSAAIFRELGEVRQAVAAHQAERDNPKMP